MNEATDEAGPDWGDADTAPSQVADKPEPAGEQSGPVFPDFHTWVGEWLVAVIHRPLKSGTLWCPEWWRHPEAVARLDALWRAWESSRAEGGAGMSYWWTMHFDSHFTVLTDAARGPFAACKDQVHDGKLDALPCNPPPSNWSWPAGEQDEPS